MTLSKLKLNSQANIHTLYKEAPLQNSPQSLLPRIHSFLLPEQGRRPQPRNYQFKNCGNPKTDIAKVGNIVLGPDPVHFPGPLHVSFQVNISRTVDAPLKVRSFVIQYLTSRGAVLMSIGTFKLES